MELKINIENTGWLGQEVRVFVKGVYVGSEHDENMTFSKTNSKMKIKESEIKEGQKSIKQS